MHQLCLLADVSKSGYFKWLSREVSENEKADRDLITQVFTKGKQKLGYRQIQMQLRSSHGVHMNHKKIQRIMKQCGLVCKVRKKNPYKAMAKKTQEHRTFENKLNRSFTQDIPQKVFCTDITYVYYGNSQKAYVSAVKDIATKEIVSFKASTNLNQDFVLECIDMLGVTQEKTLIQSDQGFHYTSPLYITKLASQGFEQSMSRKGNCLDNAPIESFFGHFKDECEFKTCTSFKDLEKVISEYIAYYNTARPQWKLKKMTPKEYRDHLLTTV